MATSAPFDILFKGLIPLEGLASRVFMCQETNARRSLHLFIIIIIFTHVNSLISCDDAPPAPDLSPGLLFIHLYV